MRFAVLTIRDGRDDVHERSIESLQLHCPVPDEHVVVDDSEHDLGFAGAIAEGWRRVAALDTDVDYVFHHEADFLFTQRVEIEAMARVLDAHPHLAQLVLKRQPWNDQERDAGGIVEMWPDEYVQRVHAGHLFTEHRLHWSTNPGLYPVGWCQQGWPQSAGSEQAWTERLVEAADVRFAYWGAKYDPPLVEHIGVERTGRGY